MFSAHTPRKRLRELTVSRIPHEQTFRGKVANAVWTIPLRGEIKFCQQAPTSGVPIRVSTSRMVPVSESAERRPTSPHPLQQRGRARGVTATHEVQEGGAEGPCAPSARVCSNLRIHLRPFRHENLEPCRPQPLNALTLPLTSFVHAHNCELCFRITVHSTISIVFLAVFYRFSGFLDCILKSWEVCSAGSFHRILGVIPSSALMPRLQIITPETFPSAPPCTREASQRQAAPCTALQSLMKVRVSGVGSSACRHSSGAGRLTKCSREPLRMGDATWRRSTDPSLSVVCGDDLCFSPRNHCFLLLPASAPFGALPGKNLNP